METTPRAPITDVAQIAKVAHEANRAFCQTLGDDMTPKPWEACSDAQRASIISGVLFRLNNPSAAPGAQHEAWRQAKIADGWKHGPVKDEAKKEHPNLVPFTDLPLNQQLKDALFQGVVDALWVEQVDLPTGPVPPGLVVQAGAGNDPRVEIAKPAHYVPAEVGALLLALGFKTVDDGMTYMYSHKGRGCWINHVYSAAEIMPIVADSYEAVGRRTKMNEIKQALDIPLGVIESIESNEPSKPR